MMGSFKALVKRQFVGICHRLFARGLLMLENRSLQFALRRRLIHNFEGFVLEISELKLIP